MTTDKFIGISLFSRATAWLLGSSVAPGADDWKVRANAVALRSTKEVLIHYKAGEADAARQKARDAGLEVLEDYRPGQFLRCAPGPGVADISATVNQVAAGDVVRLVEPDYIVSIPRPPGEADRIRIAGARAGIAVTPANPNDPDLPKLWGMRNIHAPEAWGRNTVPAPSASWGTTTSASAA